jgi:hypothetical protein
MMGWGCSFDGVTKIYIHNFGGKPLENQNKGDLGDEMTILRRILGKQVMRWQVVDLDPVLNLSVVFHFPVLLSKNLLFTWHSAYIASVMFLFLVCLEILYPSALLLKFKFQRFES